MQIKKYLIFALALLLTACGYHMRGSVQLPAGLKNIYLDGGSALLRDQFRKSLQSSSGKLVSSPTGAVIVKILDEQSQRHALSLSSRGKTNEFELVMRLDYQVFGEGGRELLLDEQPIELRRSYYNDQQDIIAKDSEEAVIRSEMYQQVVNAIISRARVALAANVK
jgi:LPS-assembly lipoprotein